MIDLSPKVAKLSVNDKKPLQKRRMQECKNLKWIFLKLKYPEKLIDSTISSFQHPPDVSHVSHTPSDSPPRITMPFKDQKSADVFCIGKPVRANKCNFESNINSHICKTRGFFRYTKFQLETGSKLAKLDRQKG